jgi:glyceraldehyde 3-phosphate dehydrogenase
MKTFGINGFGRIGRTTFRVWWHRLADQLDLKLINTSGSMDLEDWVHLLKYDSNYGVLGQEISFTPHQSAKEVTDENPLLGHIHIGDRHIIVTAQRDPAKIPWGDNGVEIVIDSTGIFITKEKALLHLQGGAKKVLISAPPKGEGIPTGIIGINTFSEEDVVDSNASCTTNSVGPVAQVIHQAFGVRKAMLTTIHSYTDDQNLHDNSHRDMRRARAAAQNIVPTSTGAAIAVTEVIPELKGLFDGLAVRVPTPVGSLSDMVFVTSRPVTKEEVNQALKAAAESDRWRGILAVTDEQIVSSDIVGRSESSIVDLRLTNVVDGDLVKVVAWYDNEYGYCCRLVEQVGNL